MHFTKLKLHGFKSFVDKTELVIGPGMTGIVGPNGCGKSNLVEALRWVMGETAPKRMRGSAMDDVIFGGTTLRPARNLAEVSLELDNATRAVMAEFNHDDKIEVTRQIERGGGSDYKVNTRPVRQRDVQLLFADCATGAHSTSLVGQGQIDALIRAKPQERRQILEEASGTAGLQARRHEAELKLRAAEQNLTRLDDVLGALETQLRSLKTQVRQASRYRNLADHIRRTEAALAHLRWVTAEQQTEQSHAACRAAETRVNELLAVVTRSTTERTEAATVLPALRQAEAVAAAAVQRLLIAREQLESEQRRVAQETEQQQQRLQQAQTDKAREEHLQQDAQQALATLAAEQERVTEQRAQLETEMPTLQSSLDDITQVVDTLEQGLQALIQEIAAAESKQKALHQTIATLEERRRTLQQRRADFIAQRDQLEADQATRPDLVLAQAMIDACEQDVAKRLEQVANAEGAQETAEAAHGAARTTVQERETQATKLQAEADALGALLQPPHDSQPVLDLVQVAPGLETALAGALGEALTAPLDTEAATHWRALPPLAQSPTLPYGCTPLAALVQAPPALARALQQIGLVESDDEGQVMAATLQPGQILVSRSGWAWRWDGFTVTPRAPTTTAVRLQQRNRLQALQSEIAAAQIKVMSAKETFATAEQERTKALQMLQDARQAQQQAYKALNDARQHHARHAQAAAATMSKLAGLADALAHLEQDEAGLQHQQVQAQTEITELPDTAAMRQEQDAKRLHLAEQRQVQIERRSKRETAAQALRSLEARLQQVVGDTNSWRNRTAAAEKHIATLANRITELEAVLVALAEKPTQLVEQRATLLDESTAAETVRSAATDELLRAEQALTAIEQRLKRDENELVDAREDRVRAEAAVTAAQEHCRVLTESIAEKLNCAPTDVLPLAELDPAVPMPEMSGLEEQLARYVRERDAMGPVNLRAEVEAETVEADRNKLQAEKDDLVSAIAKLRQGIGQLNKEARERLQEAFQKVDTNFQTLFTRLFSGGKAHLQLLNAEDPLEAGLEIFAAPPGKKVQILSLLSGGERTLTALALLFAVFQTNPSPICVLDEAEAALDEGNVDRFCNLVADIARETSTRFLVITHQRLTMARMDRLFGVTMSEKGVSQLVSVDLSQAEAVRDGVVPDNLDLAAAE
ncbi:MAG: chromosome segregation protein SMC [Alphaproteobacteria bacterium]|nr:chromosome segregation protein SMC [Alphaproteobacteria bacterium]